MTSQNRWAGPRITWFRPEFKDCLFLSLVEVKVALGSPVHEQFEEQVRVGTRRDPVRQVVERAASVEFRPGLQTESPSQQFVGMDPCLVVVADGDRHHLLGAHGLCHFLKSGAHPLGGASGMDRRPGWMGAARGSGTGPNGLNGCGYGPP
ncbi:MAG: hypothetical protein Ct9H300mP12_06520 [Acidimicrobiales bacterium]|nr:MAG: hypothetical protein Ct9H300mP12_06520 [Acidimicrobiales bacterium]